MAKFFGKIGYAPQSVEDPPESGIWKEVAIEKDYYGDLSQVSRRLETSEQINGDISIQNQLSIVSDAYASTHFFAIRYVRWAGQVWTVTTVKVQPPRLVLTLGGLYNGVTV